MSTRDEILAALTDARVGMTLKEIAPLCPSAEFDQQIVGALLAAMRAENTIHANGFRDAQNVYFLGKKPVAAHEVRESPITLNTPASEAAKAIAEMRRKTGTPNPTPAEANRETAMAKPTVVDRCIEALKKHGPCTLEQLAKRIGSTTQSLHTYSTQLQARGVHKTKTGNNPAVFSLDALARGAELGKKDQPEKGHGAAAQSGSRNGGGGAETPAAGPALLGGALETLEARKHALLAEMEKLDRAIEAVRAVA